MAEKQDPRKEGKVSDFNMWAGKYCLSPFDADSVWLSNVDGEGMQLWNWQLEKVLDDLFKSEF